MTQRCQSPCSTFSTMITSLSLQLCGGLERVIYDYAVTKHCKLQSDSIFRTQEYTIPIGNNTKNNKH